MAKERWLDIPGYEGRYAVSDLGRIWSYGRTHGSGARAGTIVKGFIGPRGYRQLCLCFDGKKVCYQFSGLVLLAFIGPKPTNHIAEHRNRDTLDNRLINLRWATHAANMTNRTPLRSDKSPGVKETKSGKWEVRVKKNGELMFYKLFLTRGEALSARKKAVWDLHRIEV